MSHRISRRDFWKFGAAAGLVGRWPGMALAADERGKQATRPKNIIFMVSDGMSLGVPSIAEPFSNHVRGYGTHWYDLLAGPNCSQGYLEMHSLNSLVTDSSAASSSWASGSRIFNGAVNTLPDGRPLKPIGQLAHAAGRRVGLVTTTTITHATPACFASVQASRDDAHLIAPQYLDVVDVLMGGGRESFEPKLRKDGRDLVGEYKAKGYAHCSTRDELAKVRRQGSRKILGLFNQGHLPFTIDEINKDKSIVPTLAEMTVMALAALERSPEGFLLQVEGGRVDHAAHDNDAAAQLWDQLAFDDALGAVLTYAAAHGDTLVVVTTDHGNANPGLNGMGSHYAGTDECFQRLWESKGSYGAIFNLMKQSAKEGKADAADMGRIVKEFYGIDLSPEHAATVADIINNEKVNELNGQHAGKSGLFAQVLGNYTGIGWTGTTHTANLCPLLAFGPGHEALAGFHRNTEIFCLLIDFMGIRHRNPSMTWDEARKYAYLAGDLHVGPHERAFA